MLHFIYTLLLAYIINNNLFSNSLKIEFIHQIQCGFLIPHSRIHFFPIYSNDKEDSGLDYLGLDEIDHVDISKEDEDELKKILDKHIELHKDEYECSQTEGNVEILKKPIPKKFDIDTSSDDFDVENYNGIFPDEEDIVDYLDPLKFRNVEKEEFTKRMIGRTYNLLNIPDNNNTTYCIDGARRFLYSLLLNQWNDNESFVLNEFVKRMKMKEMGGEDSDSISPEVILDSSPSCDVGLATKSSEHENSSSHENSLEHEKSLGSIPERIIEYTHYDLVKDLRDFKENNKGNLNFPSINGPLFIRESVDSILPPIDGIMPEYLKLSYSNEAVSVYTAWPVSTLKSPIPDGEFHEIEENYLFNANESYKSFVIDSIPQDDKYRSGLIILENELGGVRDHRIRDFIDELSCISKFPVFVPQISQDPERAYRILDRLIKNIQILYRIERISIISFGRASKLALDYCYTRLNAKEYLNTPRGALTLYEITNRTSFPLNVNIFDSDQFYENLRDEREIERAKRLNPVRPLRNVLQTLVFLDGRNINLDRALSLGTPILNIISNDINISNLINDIKYKDLEDLGYKSTFEGYDDFDIYTIFRPGGRIIKMSDATKLKLDKGNVDRNDNMGTSIKIASFKNKKSPNYLILQENDDEIRVSYSNLGV